MGLPFVYVRPEPKNMVDKIKWRVFSQKDKIVVVEDLALETVAQAVEALRLAGANVSMAAIFTYGFAVSEENFKNANIDFFCLSNYQNY
jgi:orotate phosphoribosyltransferase